MFNESIKYKDGKLYCDSVSLEDIVETCGTPVYVYSLKRAISNYQRIKKAFSELNAHIHYSAKANANLTILRTLIDAGAGIDAVSGGEIHRALAAGVSPSNIVFAGVGKSPDELRYAVEQGVGWFNIENVDECRQLNDIAADLQRAPVKIALRLNPDVAASTHPHIATGHGGAKFGLTAETIRDLLTHQSDYPQLEFAGIHIHIGSQLHDTHATTQAIDAALNLIAPYPQMQTVNIGGGLPVAYNSQEDMPSVNDFATAITPLLKDYTVLLEPGRSIIADAGILVCRVLYIKQQAGQTFVIVDAGMSELLRPALYQAEHHIVPIVEGGVHAEADPTQVVGPICETTDVLGREVMLPQLQPGNLLAILTSGAYGMVMANNYNARPRPPEIVIAVDGTTWHIARQRETWDDLISQEISKF